MNVIASAIRAAAGYVGEGHGYALSLAAALLDGGVAPEAVPAVMRAVGRAVALPVSLGEPEQLDRAARDTVRRWSLGRSVRRDLPPALRAAVDEVVGARPAPAESLDEATARLEHVLRQGPDGLSVVKAPCGLGKALALDTPIPTPSGWSTMGDLAVGDFVFDERGEPCRVTFATDTMLDRECFDVVFDDGSTITADGEHRWRTWSKLARQRRVDRERGKASQKLEIAPRVVTTAEMLATLRVRVSPSRSEANHAIEVAQPLRLPDALLQVHPYALGVWLGDGDSRAATLTSADVEIVKHLRDVGIYVGPGKPDKRSRAVRYPLRLAAITPGRCASTDWGTSLSRALRDIGVLGEKHIPSSYLRGSYEQRLALLQGLLDTDGTISREGTCEISLSNERLAHDVNELCLTLGLRTVLRGEPARLYGKDCGTRWRVGFTPRIAVFRLSRKLERLRTSQGQAGRTAQRFVVDIRPRESVPVRCITVDSPSHLYLASRAFIPTHNTHAARRIAAERAARGGERKRNTRTSLSVPTNALAEQVTADLRAAGVPTLRVFSPVAARTAEGEPECRYQASARHLAAGGLSVRWELCEGRRREPCPYRDECGARDGADGPTDARVVVGNHGLLTELEASAGTTGLLVIDEPPPPHDDVVLSRADLVEAAGRLHLFAWRYAAAMAPALAAVTAWLDVAPVGEPGALARALELAPADLVEAAGQAVGAYDAAEAVSLALEPGQRTPPVERRELGAARTAVDHARRIGEACRVLAAVHRALTDEGVVAAVYEPHGGGPRVIALTGPSPALTAALRREGRVVLTAADADVYLDAYRAMVGYEPHYVALGAPDGCAVRRVVVRTKTATRAEWLSRGRRPAGALRAALALCPGSAAVVTFKALEPWVRAELKLLGRADVEVGHYGALRGLDAWRELDALVTLGDPWPNLDHADRARVDARAAAAAELEQAHGRLRVVHRTRPATQVHVGDVLPAGWRAPIEEVTAVGRPPNGPAAPVAELVESLGGVRAAARAAGVSPAAMGRYASGERACPPEVVRACQAAASAASSGAVQGVPETAGKEPYYQQFRGQSPDTTHATTREAWP